MLPKSDKTRLDRNGGVLALERGGGAEATLDSIPWLQCTPAFAVSAALHLLVLFVVMNLVWEEARPPEKGIPTVYAIAAPTPPPKAPDYDPRARRAPEKRRKVPGLETPNRRALPREELNEYDLKVEIPLGTSPENLLDRRLEYSGLVNMGSVYTSGVGQGIGGAYGNPRGDLGGMSPGGGTTASEDAVRAALEWLRRHQSPDGSWKSQDYVAACAKPCANVDARHAGSRGWQGHDVGVTGLAILAFTGYGHTHRDGLYEEYIACLFRALEYLKRVQVRSGDPSSNGRFGPADGEQWIYDHAIATLAMAELLAMSGDDVLLKSSVTDAVELCLRAQNTGFGWKYGVKPGKNDSSVTGWMVLALKAARSASIDIPRQRFDEAFQGALSWFDRATSTSTGRAGYEVPGDEGSRLAGAHPEPYPYSKDLSCMTAVAVLCRLFAGQSRGAPLVKRGVDLLMKETPLWSGQEGKRLSRINMYYWYYGSYALFQFGGSLWKRWNEAMLAALLPSQRQGAELCEDGSWDPIDEWGLVGGRVYSTALCAMTLEVYYRYRRIEHGAGGW